MKYLRIFLTSNRVLVCDSKPLNEDTQTSKTVEYYGEMPQCDYLTFTNLREETKRELVYELNEDGEVVGVETQRKYLTCDLIPNFYLPKTEEEIAKEKDLKYSARVTELVRLKYDANAVEALLANYNDDKEKYQEEFDIFTAYRKECKKQANAEVYGV